MRIIVSERLYRAVKIGAQAGLVGAVWGFFRVLGQARRLPLPRFALFAAAVPAMSFALYFTLVFLLAYGFPPESDSLSNLSFPGARWVVWPIMALLTLGTAFLVIHSRP